MNISFPLEGDALRVLLEAPQPDQFGPNSSYPALRFFLRGADAMFARVLRSLPCPVIGIGEGPLASACDVVVSQEAESETMLANIINAPLAAMVLVQLLRATETLPVPEALVAESFAYATIQMGPDFARWQRTESRLPSGPDDGPPLGVQRNGSELHLTLNRPSNRNAINLALRDALCEAFDLAAVDPEIENVLLTGTGDCFSVGGDVSEFGRASDPATAHWIRCLRLPARGAFAVQRKLTAKINGPAVGAGIEIAAFAGQVVASPRAWFQLPELKYGLLPGAGGTVSVPRRIGRQRAAAMMLSMRRLSPATALQWGLIDAIAD